MSGIISAAKPDSGRSFPLADGGTLHIRLSLCGPALTAEYESPGGVLRAVDLGDCDCTDPRQVYLAAIAALLYDFDTRMI